MATNHRVINLTGSTNGIPISITSTSGTGQTIHTATSTANEVDVLELFASNEDSSSRTLTLQIGGTTDYTNTEKFTLPALASGAGTDGRIPLGNFILDGGAVMTAIASVTSKVKITGNVKRITNA